MATWDGCGSDRLRPSSSRDSGSTSMRGSDQGHWGVEMSAAQPVPTGLVHLGARLYDPATGRFVREDTAAGPANPRSPNGYASAASDPITAKDGNGLYIGEDLDVIADQLIERYPPAANVS